MSRIEEFKLRAAALVEQEKQAAAKSRLVSWFRLVVFLAGVATAWFFFKEENYVAGGIAILLFYILFTVVMRWHARLEYKYSHFVLLRKLSLEEVERLEGKMQQFDDGASFINDQHPYTSDLDLFGQNSLFQLVNRSVSSIGKHKLARWMQAPAPVAEIVQRQEAVAELAHANQLTWLQDFITKPRHYKHKEESSSGYLEWLRNSEFYSIYPFLRPLLIVLPVLTVASLIAWASGYPEYIAYFFLSLQYGISYKFRVQREEFYENSIAIYEAVQSYTDQLRHIEEHTFTSPILKQAQQQLSAGATKASVAIGKLATIIDYFSWRLSTLMSFFLNTILMWDLFWIYRLETWKKKHLEQVQQSLEVLATVEALTSIASYKYANPEYAVAEISDQPFEFDAVQLAHPLIFTVNRVANSFRMQGAGKTIVVTGSNMSGKTTFLRTVGINIVLALMGAPVAAEKLRVAPVQVYTAMRTADNLAENTSSFYAELKRLRILLNMTEAGDVPVFYLLDEILKGTNSRDRHAGAMALIRQLHQRNASGLISTHDLELGAMEDELKGSVENYSFNSTIEGDKIVFDYTLQRGICRSFNASKLMQLMGIAIEENV